MRSTTVTSSSLDSNGRPKHRPQQMAAVSNSRQPRMQRTAPTGSTFLPPIAKSTAAAAVVDGADVGAAAGLPNNQGMEGLTSHLGTKNSAGFQVCEIGHVLIIK